MGARKRQEVLVGRSLRLFVYPWGIRWISGAEEVSAFWDEVTHVWQAITRHSANGSPTYTEYHYTVRLADARASGAVLLQPTPGITTPVTIEQLGRLLETGVTRAQLPKAIERFNAGQAVAFGPLSVGPSGITAGDQWLPWSGDRGRADPQGDGVGEEVRQVAGLETGTGQPDPQLLHL